MAILTTLASAARIECHLEPIHYASLWNLTALRVCEGPPRPERVCIVGAGPAGVHLGWLLRRRRFTNVTIFESNSRLGGDVWTRERPATAADGDNITRELGAAFLSPDYVEVRALLSRFGLDELPLSTRTQLEFHVPRGGGDPGEDVVNANTWAAERLARVTNSSNATRNAELVAKFGVDGIPHLALISAQRKLVGTLVGAVPDGVLEQNLRALAAGEALPYANTNTNGS